MEKLRPAPGYATKFISDHVGYRGEACLRWPFSLNPDGYGHVGGAKRRATAHRAMCIAAHGPPPFAKAEAAHSCGNPWCVSPLHVRWATSRENNHDRYLHGTMPRGMRAPSAKFTPEQVMAIVADPRNDSQVAREMGCSITAIWAIRNGKNWRHVTGIRKAA